MSDFSPSIRNWYRLNGRNLPWRETKDPYKIWLSEIILQQTRVDQGLSYYLKFINHYPSIQELANADEQMILNDWQGLGYYSRARNLHAAAKFIVSECKGEFPSNYNDLLALKGVGTYTASAIASFAFNEPKAVVDGNVYRLLSRYFKIDTPIDSTSGKKEFQELAEMLLPAENAAEHNQAIMEMGALVCTPSPNCNSCPLQNGCLSLKDQTQKEYPVKSKKTKVRNRYFHYFLYSDSEHTVIQKRIQKDIWQHLHEFPLIETESNEEIKPQETEITKISEEVVHILSHQRIHAKFYHVNQLPEKLNANWQKIKISRIQDYPLPRIIDRYLEKYPI